MRMRVFSGVCVFGLSLAAIAGIPCPDPLAYKIVDGYCVLVPGGGYAVVDFQYTPGGCVSPGNSAYSCEVKTEVTTANRKKGDMWMRYWGELDIWFRCIDDTPIGVVGARYGKSNLDNPCDYCTGT